MTSTVLAAAVRGRNIFSGGAGAGIRSLILQNASCSFSSTNQPPPPPPPPPGGNNNNNNRPQPPQPPRPPTPMSSSVHSRFRGNSRSAHRRSILRSKLLAEKSKFQWAPHEFGLRSSAVTVFPGDFGDNDQLKEGAERAWKTKPNASQQQQEGLDRARKVQEIMREEEQKKEAERQRNLEKLYNPKPHPTRIDERGLVYSRGGRKAARARVWMTAGTGEITVNRKDYADYFERESTREDLIMPFVVTDTVGQFDVVAAVRGGGLSGQAGAIRFGIAHCLNRWNADLYRAPLKFKKFLKRDNRIVESKRVGRVKARKRPQWSKR